MDAQERLSENSPDVVKKSEDIRTKLERQDSAEFQQIGQSFEVR
jgi:hypothetical protein